MASYILPGVGGQQATESGSAEQASPLLKYYSPRLFGAPPQLTNQCDMRLMSSDGTNPGAVGDFYLTKILQDANVANFVIGRARFIGGHSSISNIIREAYFYYNALSKYNIFGSDGSATNNASAVSELEVYNSKETYKNAYGLRNDETYSLKYDDEGMAVLDLSSVSEATSTLEKMQSALKVEGTFMAELLTSFSVQQPFYTFEDDWYTYINNVKMMINTAVIMLGLQKYCVRIGDTYYPIGMDANISDPNNDVWANYRFITPTDNLGSVTAVVADNGETSQYVSFMIDPTSVSEQFQNTIGESQMLSSVINQGSTIGNEIAFISNAAGGSGPNDMTIKLAKESREAAEDAIKNMSSGSGRFTAAIASSMARSFVGDHTVYPDVFQSHNSTSSITVTTHLTASSGDPYAYLTDILVPYFFALGMVLPQLSNNSAAAYTYPPIVQCNIPGMWGTRLGMIESVTVTKNPGQKDVSINGYPLQIDLSIQIRDLEHVLMTSPMSKPSVFLNNRTMFDYIAQMSGVDKYRVNGSMRTVARLALAASAANNLMSNIGDALLTDWHSFINKKFNFESQ